MHRDSNNSLRFKMLSLSDCSPEINWQNPAKPKIPKHRDVVGYLDCRVTLTRRAHAHQRGGCQLRLARLVRRPKSMRELPAAGRKRLGVQGSFRRAKGALFQDDRLRLFQILRRWLRTAGFSARRRCAPDSVEMTGVDGCA